MGLVESGTRKPHSLFILNHIFFFFFLNCHPCSSFRESTNLSCPLHHFSRRRAKILSGLTAFSSIIQRCFSHLLIIISSVECFLVIILRQLVSVTSKNPTRLKLISNSRNILRLSYGLCAYNIIIKEKEIFLNFIFLYCVSFESFWFCKIVHKKP